MKKLLIGLMLIALVIPASAQRHNTRGGGGGGRRSAPSRPAPQRTSRAPARTAYRAPARTTSQARPNYTPRSSYRGYANSAPYTHTARTTNTYGMRRQTTGATFGRRFTGDMRPHGTGHARDYFAGRGWHQGPAWRAPLFSCYVGFSWDAMPSLYYTVWIYDPTSGQYYEAYYYPEYGYYAWASNPLVAVGIYTPSMSFEVG